MRRNIYNSIYYMLLGLFLIVISMIALMLQDDFLVNVFGLLGGILIINGLHELNVFYKKRFKGSLVTIIFNLIIGTILIIYPGIPIRLLLIIFSIYIILNGIVKFINYLNYKKDQVNWRLPVLIGSLSLIIIGIALLLGHYATYYHLFNFICFYGLLLGCNYIVDGIFVVIDKQKKDDLKRRIRIPVPLVLTSLLPKVMMDYINERLKVSDKDFINNEDDCGNVEILIHVSNDGFGTIGHCDVCLDDQVFSYGNYDHDSIRMFEALGDGVLFQVRKDAYINFCVETNKQTIFSYRLNLNHLQLNKVIQELRQLMANSYRWYPRSYYDHEDSQDYASLLYLKTKAVFYKFKKGRFKTYFVFGSNCVQLVEQIMGKAGLDIINLNGIIAPGTYQTYLEKEFQRLNGLVISKKIYNELTNNVK